MDAGTFTAFDISASALRAQRVRMNVIAANLANAETTRDAAGKVNPFRRRLTFLAAGAPDDPGSHGVHVAGIQADPSPLRRVYEPGHPEADVRGYRQLPNVNPIVETVDMMAASRSYEANITAMQVSRRLFDRALTLLV